MLKNSIHFNLYCNYLNYDFLISLIVMIHNNQINHLNHSSDNKEILKADNQLKLSEQ